VAKTTQKQGQQAETSSSGELVQRSSLSPDPYGEMLALQGMVGNGAVNRLLQGGRSAVVQAKLTIGQPGDKYEREADRVAKEVMRRIHNPQSDIVQGQSLLEEEDEHLRRKPSLQGQIISLHSVSPGDGQTVSPNLEAAIRHARGGGEALPESVRLPMEQAFGADFSKVKVHNSAESDCLNCSLSARAFTTGQEIFFRQREYTPESQKGQEILAHELAHVIQQKKSTSPMLSYLSSGIYLQRLVAITRGQYGQELRDYQSGSGLPDQPFRLLNLSPSFRSMVIALDDRYVTIYNFPNIPTEEYIDSNGFINDSPRNGEWAGSGRRVIYIRSSGLGGGSWFEPAFSPGSNVPVDQVLIGDQSYLDSDPSERNRHLPGLIESIAHETTHVYNSVTPGASPTPTAPSMAATIEANIREEALTRSSEHQILTEIWRRSTAEDRRSLGSRGPAPLSQAVEREIRSQTPRSGLSVEAQEELAYVERSFVSRRPVMTYLESYFFDYKLRGAMHNTSPEEILDMDNIVAHIPLSPEEANQYLDRDCTIWYHDPDEDLYVLLTSEYGRWLFFKRVVGNRWSTFRESHSENEPGFDVAKERILEEHAAAYFGSEIRYHELP
jgi:hypothetical protein